MAIYLLIYALVFGTYLYQKKYFSVKNLKPFYNLFYFTVFILWFVSAFRAEWIGSDHYTYNLSFYTIGLTGDDYYPEKGYVLLNRILYLIYSDPVILSIAVTSLLVFSFVYYVKQNVPIQYWALALLIFVFQPYLYIQSTFNAMRQGCANAFVLMAIPYLLEKKWFKYLLLIIVACCFHKSSIIFIFLILISQINFKPNVLIVLAIISLVLNFINVSNIFFHIVNWYSRYETYEASLLNAKPYVLFIFCVILYLSSKYYQLFTTQKEKFFVDIFLLSLCLLIITVQNDMLYRIYFMFALVAIPGITIICKNLIKINSSAEFFLVGYYNCFFLGYISLWFINNDRKYYPFEFVFFN